MADLRRTFIEFKFPRGQPQRSDSLRADVLISIRTATSRQLQAAGPSSGALIATPRWRTFRRPISSAKNLDQFLKAVNEEDPPNFKLVWSQNGPIQRYVPGDSLLIDDLRIVIE